MSKKIKLIMMAGIPGSGKSTIARKIALSNPKEYVIVSRDSLRDMCGKYWVPKREDLISDMEYDSICSALNRGYNVIVDATNLNPSVTRKLQDLIRLTNQVQEEYEVEFEDYHVIEPLWKCIYRNYKRTLFGGRYVPYKVIKRFHEKHLKILQEC